MSRPLRFVPAQKTLVEVSTRTVQSRFLLRPSNALNEIVLGILGRAQEIYGVGLCGYAFISSHYLLLLVDTAKQLADFMGYFNSNLAREAGRLVVGDPRQWPGVHAIRPLLDGDPAQGIWFDRTQEYAARRRGEEFERLRYTTPYSVTLSPLPCWEDLPAELQRQRIAEIAEEIGAEAAARQEEKGIAPIGADAIRRQDPHQRPKKTKKSSAPLFHAASKRVRGDLYNIYYVFVAAFREAAEKLKAGNRNAVFPIGSFPPGLPFVSG